MSRRNTLHAATSKRQLIDVLGSGVEVRTAAICLGICRRAVPQLRARFGLVRDFHDDVVIIIDKDPHVE